VIAVDGGALPNEVPVDRRFRILARLVPEPEAGLGTEQLCQVGAEVTGVSGAGIMLMSDDLALGSVCSSNEVSQLIEDLQFTLGEGPCVDAHTYGRPVLEPDLADPETPRWLAFSPRAVAADARAVFGFPLQVGTVRLGALNLYRDRPGPLSDDQHADSLVLADVAAQVVLTMQANSPLEGVASELDRGANFHLIEHQASGMVAAQLGVSVVEALIRIRAHAFSHDLTVVDVAQAVVDRRLRFDSS
jgi:GAF domain-containing protein